MEIQNAIIKSAPLTAGDHGCLSAWLHLDYGGSGQGFGGYSLYLPASFKHHRVLSVAGHFIWRTMEVAGVSEWGRLVGQPIRVRHDRQRIMAIGHIIHDDWFEPTTEFLLKKLRNKS